MKITCWISCLWSILAASSLADAFLSGNNGARSARRRRQSILLRHVDSEDERNPYHDQQQQEPLQLKFHSSDSRDVNPITYILPLAVLTLPLVAAAIDHPVDHAFLGIPIPVPDVRYFVSGGLCAALSHGVTTPIDVVKTRIQSEPEVFNQGLVSATKAIVSEDGIGSLLGGLGPTVVGYGIEGAMKFGLYESLKPAFAQFLGDNVALAYLGASVCAGAAASFLLCPMEHTRIRLVTEPSFAKGLVRTNCDEDLCLDYPPFVY